MSRLTLFLDFDGVLHPLAEPTAAGPGRAYTGPLLTDAPVLAELLAPWIHDIEIVIASTWARTRSLDAIRALLPASLSARVEATIWDSVVKTQATRYEAITQWQERHGRAESNWLALDDDARGWPDEQRHRLVWCSSPVSHPEIQARLLGRLVEALGLASVWRAADRLAPVDVLRHVNVLFDRWGIENHSMRAQLLDLPSASEATHLLLMQAPSSMARARRLLGLHAALRVLFPENPDLRWSWVSRANRRLDGDAPLTLILRDGNAGLERVIAILEGELQS